MKKTTFKDPEDLLTPEEKNSCKETFDIFDKDGDGCLDERELKKCLEGKSQRLFGIILQNWARGHLMKK